MNNFRKIEKITKAIKNGVKNLTEDSFLYVHYPFCLNFCHFCLYKIHRYDKVMSDKFLKCYKREISLYAEALSGFKFRNIHIGGGTPSLVSPKLLTSPLNKLVNFKNLERFVMEVFPRDDLADYLKELKRYNVSKIQLGIQTLNEKILKNENRLVSKKTILNSLKILSKSNLIWSVDLIYGFKNEDILGRDYVSELETILNFSPGGFH